MKLFFYNDHLNNLSCNGSFSCVSREMSFAAQELGCYGNLQEADYIIFIDAFDVDKKVNGKPVIPWLVSEYSLAPKFVVDKLIKNNTFCLSISDQSTKSFISAGLPPELIKTVHLGARVQSWPNLNQRARKFGDPLIYITNNSSNNRSGYSDFIPAWIEFAKGKNVKLIIKDQNNPHFVSVLREIDKEQKIIYEGLNLSHEKLVFLYNKAHIHCYINSVTSFGLTIFESALTGCCQIVSNASAIPEFTSEEFVTYVECQDKPVDIFTLGEWNAWGLKNNLLPLNHYNGPLLAPRPKHDSILQALENSYKNYEKLVEKNKKFVQNIEKSFKWTDSVKKIISILKDKNE